MNTTFKRISAVAGLAAIVLVAVWYLALFRPQTHDLSAADKAHAAAEQKVTQLQGQLVQLNALKAEIPADKVALSALDAAVPSSPQLDATLRQLHTVANTSGVTLAAVSPSAPATAATGSQASSGTPSITLSMSASGSYAQVMDFLTGLTTMPRTVVISSLDLSGTSKLTASITATIFYTGA